MSPELQAAKQALEAAQANYQKMLNDAKSDQIAIIKQIMQDYGITVQDLSAKSSIPKEPKIAAKAGIYLAADGQEHTYVLAKGRKPAWFNDAVFVRDIPSA
jgi:DNA-binding protein H-NS